MVNFYKIKIKNAKLDGKFPVKMKMKQEIPFSQSVGMITIHFVYLHPFSG